MKKNQDKNKKMIGLDIMQQSRMSKVTYEQMAQVISVEKVQGARDGLNCSDSDKEWRPRTKIS